MEPSQPPKPEVEAAGGADSQPTPEQVRFFESRVRPLLIQNCFKCHGAEKQQAGLRLDSRLAYDRQQRRSGQRAGPAMRERVGDGR